MTNTAKYLSYVAAWRRIKAATTGGFYFEVVTLCESIISDRLLSYVSGVNPQSKVGVKTHFASLITEWRKLAIGSLPKHGSSDLGKAVDLWREERNAVVHGLAKSAPGTPTVSVLPFVKRTEVAAANGVMLAKAVSRWHKRQLNAHRKAQAPAAPPKQMANPSVKRTA